MELSDMKIIPYYQDDKMVGVTLRAPEGYKFDISNSEEIDLVLWNCKALDNLKSKENEYDKKVDRG